MKRNTFLYAIAAFVGFIASINSSKAQCPPGAVCATYQSGSIDSDYSFTSSSGSSSCPGTLNLIIPSGNRIDSISTSYDVTAAGGGWMSEQRSRLSSSTTSSAEATLSNGSGSSGGTLSYSRAGLTFANGAVDTVLIQLELGRTYGGSGCNATFNFVVDSTWEVIAYYSAIPNCPEPISLSSTNITADSATISWTEVGTASSWQYEFGPSGYTVGSGTKMLASSQSAVLSGLMSASAYDWTVRSICAVGDTSPWSTPASFNTLIQSAQGVNCVTGGPQVVFSDDFETIGGWTGTVTSGFGWTYDANGTPSSSTGPASAHSGINYLFTETSSGTLGATTSAISPVIDLSSGTSSAELSFWYHAYGATIGSLEVGVSTSATGPFTNVFTNSGQIQTSDTDPFINVGVNLDAYVGQQIYLEFKSTRGSSYTGDMAIDLVEVTTCVTCPKPSALTATNITNTAATLGWTENGSATAWELEYGIAGFTLGSGTRVSTSVTNPFTLTGLSTYASYDWYVRSICAVGDSSDWSNVNNFFVGLPMSGTFTIDSAVATGGTNFQSFADFTNLISNVGVSGAVTANVVANSGPYNEQVIFNTIPGVSSTNTITINGNGNTISFAPNTSDRRVVGFDGAGFITMNDFTIVSTDATYGFGIHFMNGSNHITVNNCNVDMSAVTSTSSINSAGVISSSSASSTGAGGNANFITISNCDIFGGSTGLYYGVRFYGASTSALDSNISISNSIIRDFYAYGVYMYNVKNSTVENNDINRANKTTVTTFYGIYTGGGTQGLLANSNRIHNTHGSATSLTGAVYTIYASSNDADTANPNSFVNNAIYDITNNGTIYAIYNFGSDYQNYVNNTISLDHSASTGGTTRGFYQSSTATGINLINNNISITKGGSGVKHGVYLNTPASTITASHNNIYMNSAGSGAQHVGRDNATDRTTMSDWVATAYGTATIGANPMFIDAVNGDLTPLSDSLDNRGTPIPGLTADINGNPRNATTPDIGAVEFVAPESIPFMEDFQTFGTSTTISTNGWTRTATSNPRFQSGSTTSSSGTGPSFDHTIGTGGTFVYLETSSSTPGNSDTLVSPSILIGSNDTTVYLQYWYHMFGPTTGSLEVFIDTNGTLIPLGSLVGQQQANQSDAWRLNAHLISGLQGKLAKIKFVGTAGSSFTGDLAVDDVSLSLPPTCFQPSSPSIANLTTTSVDLNWVDINPSATWEVEYDTSGFSPGTGTSVIVSTNTASISGLSANTNYDWYVRAICSVGDTTAAVQSSFYTGYCIPAPSSVDGNGIINVAFDTVNNTTVAEPGNYGDYSAIIGAVGQGSLVNIDITYATGYTYVTEIWVDWNNDLDFDDTLENVYSGVSLNTNPTTLTATWTVPSNVPFGQYRMRIGGADSGPPTPCYTGSYGSYEDYTIAVGCPSAYTAPYVQTFDGNTTPDCWSQSAVQDGPWVFGAPGFTWNTSGCSFVPTDHTGNSGSFAALDFSGTGVVDVVLEMPVVNVSTLTNPYLEFYFAMCGIGYTPINKLYVEAFDSTNFVIIDSIQQNTNGWMSFGYDLSNYTYNSGDVKVRFRASSAGNTVSMFLGDQAIDDVSIKEAPADNLAATAIVNPTSGCGLSATSSVEMTISNVGAAAQSNFQVGYSVNGVAITPETFTGSIAPGTSANYIFTTTANLSTAGAYTIDAYTLLANDYDTTNDIVSTSIISSLNVVAFPYTESFETSNGGWIAGGTNSSWAHGVPAGSVIDTASNGTQAWVTNLTGNYNSSEFSFVNSPCLDFSNVSDPYLEMDIWYDIENQWDGTVIQVSSDQGATWTNLGALNDTVNWYNDTSRSAFDNTGSGASWTGDGTAGSQGWITAKHYLTGMGGLPSVQLRLVMVSDGSVNNEGFAFDNVNIYNRIPPVVQPPYYAIGLINKEDTLGVADSLGVICWTSGTVAGVDLDGNNGISFTIIDQSGATPEGMNIFNFNDVSGYVVNEGDSIMVRGDIQQFNGLTELFPDSIMIISTNASLPAHTLVTTLDESTESQLIEIRNFVVVTPSGNGSYNMTATNGTDTLTIRVDADTDVNDSLSIAGARLVAGDTICSLKGIGGQFDNSNPYLSGYQIFPMRFSDIDTTSCLTIVGINKENTNTALISFYPNPNDGQFKLQIQNVTAPNSTLEVVNINGQVVYSENLIINGSLSKDINLNVGRGLYFVRLINRNGVKIEKLIIE